MTKQHDKVWRLAGEIAYNGAFDVYPDYTPPSPEGDCGVDASTATWKFISALIIGVGIPVLEWTLFSSVFISLTLLVLLGILVLVGYGILYYYDDIG